MRKFLTIMILGSTLIVPLNAVPPEISEEDTTISGFQAKAYDLIKRFGAENVVFVLDNDGTLTEHSEPGIHPPKPRGHVDLLVHKLSEMGASLIVSSAWDKMDETLARLDGLKLAALMGANEKREHFVVNGCNNKIFERQSLVEGVQRQRFSQRMDVHIERLEELAQDEFKNEMGLLEVLRQGNVVSCRSVKEVEPFSYDNYGEFRLNEKWYAPTLMRNSPPRAPDFKATSNLDFFYREKHFSVDYAGLLKEGQKFKAVCVLEDSSYNLVQFKKRMNRTAWYSDAEEVHLCTLSDIRGHVYKADIIEEFQGMRFMEPYTPEKKDETILFLSDSSSSCSAYNSDQEEGSQNEVEIDPREKFLTPATFIRVDQKEVTTQELDQSPRKSSSLAWRTLSNSHALNLDSDTEDIDHEETDFRDLSCSRSLQGFHLDKIPPQQGSLNSSTDSIDVN